MFDLISIGDCTIDHYFKIHDAHLAFNLDKTRKELCINYGDKIPVEEYYQFVAGNNANNAVGCSRLGLKVAAYMNVGSDADGQKVIDKLKEEKIDPRYIVVNKGMSSNSSAVINFQGERTILVYHQPWEYHLPDLEKTKWVYFSSMSASFAQSSIIAQLENYLERTGARMAFNPGTYQLEYGVKKFPKILSLTALLIVNLTEAKRILKKEGEEKTEIKKILLGLRDLGPQMIIITCGSEGSYGFDGQSFYKLEVFPARLTEMTGAGDAYSAGVVAGLFYGKDLAEAMRWGAANSASVVEHVGPQSGLLTYEQIQQRLKKNSKITCKNI
jgi:ribokinase